MEDMSEEELLEINEVVSDIGDNSRGFLETLSVEGIEYFIDCLKEEVMGMKYE